MAFRVLYSSFPSRKGIPQFSVLGPVLFSLFINGLPTFLPTSVKVSLYVDDLAIWTSSPSVECAASTVQLLTVQAVEVAQGSFLNKLVEWSSTRRLPLNPLKCESFLPLRPLSVSYKTLSVHS